jgi:O-antigen ligase
MILYYILILSFPLMAHPYFTYQIGGFTVTQCLGIVCLAYALYYNTRRQYAVGFLSHWQVRLFLLFYVLALLSVVSSPSSAPQSQLIRVYTAHLAFMFVVLIVLDSEGRLRWSLLTCAAGIGLGSLYCIREWQRGVVLFGAGFRPGWVTGDSNYFTASAIVGLQFGFMFLGKQHARWERVFAAGCITVSLVAITLGASRGGFIGLAVSILFQIWRSQYRVRNLVVVVLLAGLLFSLLPQSPLERLLYPSSSDVSAANARLVAWGAAWKMICAHPVLGIGLGNFKPLMASYSRTEESSIAHNTYLEIAAEMGIPGFLVFVALLIASWMGLQRVRRHALSIGAPLIAETAHALQAGMLGFWVAIAMVSAEFVKLLWFAIFLSAALPQLLQAYFLEAQARHKTNTTGVALLVGQEEVVRK